MLATLVDAPFVRPNWVFEEKYDGVRIVAYKEGERVSLISRNAIDRTARYPKIVAAIRKLDSKALCLDGEVVVFDSKKISRFQLLQQGKGQPQFAVFDCLYANGKDLRKEALADRRKALETALRANGPLVLSARIDRDGLKAFQIAARRGLEGVVAKNELSSYVEKRSAEWLKVKVHQEDEFVIAGFTEPTGARQHFGALLLGFYVKGKLRYAGKVGTGFGEEMLEALNRKFRRLVREKSPFTEEVRERGATFLTPQLVAQVSFTEWTKHGKLRHPVFLGLRDDKKASEVAREA
ncbi:MAG TPA: non-homologous end-joining DNA ligase [Candidatus Acidoferrum sp.]|jgi:bifunctional non-homologous end joining protein LigD